MPLGPPQVVDGGLPPGPLPEDERRVVRRDDFRLVRECEPKSAFELRSTPASNSPVACESPESDVSKRDDDIGLTHLDFSLESFDALKDDW